MLNPRDDFRNIPIKILKYTKISLISDKPFNINISLRECLYRDNNNYEFINIDVYHNIPYNLNITITKLYDLINYNNPDTLVNIRGALTVSDGLEDDYTNVGFDLYGFAKKRDLSNKVITLEKFKFRIYVKILKDKNTVFVDKHITNEEAMNLINQKIEIDKLQPVKRKQKEPDTTNLPKEEPTKPTAPPRRLKPTTSFLMPESQPSTIGRGAIAIDGGVFQYVKSGFKNEYSVIYMNSAKFLPPILEVNDEYSICIIINANKPIILDSSFDLFQDGRTDLPETNMAPTTKALVNYVNTIIYESFRNIYIKLLKKDKSLKVYDFSVVIFNEKTTRKVDVYYSKLGSNISIGCIMEPDTKSKIKPINYRLKAYKDEKPPKLELEPNDLDPTFVPKNTYVFSNTKNLIIMDKDIETTLFDKEKHIFAAPEEKPLFELYGGTKTNIKDYDYMYQERFSYKGVEDNKSGNYSSSTFNPFTFDNILFIENKGVVNNKRQLFLTFKVV